MLRYLPSTYEYQHLRIIRVFSDLCFFIPAFSQLYSDYILVATIHRHEPFYHVLSGFIYIHDPQDPDPFSALCYE